MDGYNSPVVFQEQFNIDVFENHPNYHALINENIKRIEIDLNFAKNNIVTLDAQRVSKSLIESVRSTLQNIFDNVISTEKLFAEWNKIAVISQDASIQYSELESTFKKLVEEVQTVSSSVKKAAHNVTLAKSQSLKSSISATNTLASTLGHSIASQSTVNLELSHCQSIESDMELQRNSELFQYNYFQSEESPLLEESIINERNSNIKRINGQVSKINQMFNSLTNIVAHQGQDIDLIHNTVRGSKDDSLDTLEQFSLLDSINKKKTRFAPLKYRRNIIICIIIVCLCFIVFKNNFFVK